MYFIKASIRIGIHNSSFSVIDHHAKNKSKSRKHGKYDFSFENLETVHNESIKEESRLQEAAVEDVEEAVMVAFDRSGEGGELRIVTDPSEIRNIELEEQERKRNVSFRII